MSTAYYIQKKKKAEYISFSSSHEMFSGINHTVGYKTSLSKFNRNYIKHLFQPQWCETRNQLQKEKREKKKHMETQQQKPHHFPLALSAVNSKQFENTYISNLLQLDLVIFINSISLNRLFLICLTCPGPRPATHTNSHSTRCAS